MEPGIETNICNYTDIHVHVLIKYNIIYHSHTVGKVPKYNRKWEKEEKLLSPKQIFKSAHFPGWKQALQ